MLSWDYINYDDNLNWDSSIGFVTIIFYCYFTFYDYYWGGLVSNFLPINYYKFYGEAYIYLINCDKFFIYYILLFTYSALTLEAIIYLYSLKFV